MTHTFKTSVFALCLLSAGATFSGCGDDDDAGPTDTAGTGGKGSAGSSNNGGKTNDPPSEGGSGTAGDKSEGGTPGAAGGTSEGGMPGAAGDTSSAGAGGAAALLECTQVKYGAGVTADYVTAAQPAAEGGTIEAGTYQLTKLTHYGNAEASTGNDVIHSAVKLTASTLEWANQGKDEPETRGSYTFVVDDTDLDLTVVCPEPGAADPVPFTADGDTFIIYLDAEYTYTKE